MEESGLHFFDSTHKSRNFGQNFCLDKIDCINPEKLRNCCPENYTGIISECSYKVQNRYFL